MMGKKRRRRRRRSGIEVTGGAKGKQTKLIELRVHRDVPGRLVRGKGRAVRGWDGGYVFRE